MRGRSFSFQVDFRTSDLPLARIKKIMKLDDDVKMISAEVPILFAKAAELFIQELTIHSWLQTEESRRRTLQVGYEEFHFERINFFFFSVMMSQQRYPKMNYSIF